MRPSRVMRRGMAVGLALLALLGLLWLVLADRPRSDEPRARFVDGTAPDPAAPSAPSPGSDLADGGERRPDPDAGTGHPLASPSGAARREEPTAPGTSSREDSRRFSGFWDPPDGESGELVVRVVDASGAPVPDVTVEPAGFGAAGARSYLTIRTHEEGRTVFRTEPGLHRVTVRPPDAGGLGGRIGPVEVTVGSCTGPFRRGPTRCGCSTGRRPPARTRWRSGSAPARRARSW